ncbi:DNA-directed RNA polymerase I subunit RPA49 [Leptidea sinapis]|uniref:DNA-directed RNA polymerase I subunit RPA49 n=1 Tax=Leptidea sinapis TaxID=189913 RepID=A0A5E4QH67_9NEOP|nr:DNA-directed RNA polymerase I subunit RPA49 [Leptidea sinapis]VVC96872.1 unnamed protein product [Leptidea sinapis]
MTQRTIDKVYKKSNQKPYPIIVNYQHAYPTDEFQSYPCTLLKNTETDQKTLVTETDGLLYAGEEDDDNLGQTLLLVRDKSSGKVRLIESSYIELRPILKEDLNINDTQVLETSNLELSRKFGSKKQRQQMEQREKLKMNMETVTEQVKKATEKVKSEQLDLTSYNNSLNSDDFYIPDINRNATRVEDVYDFDKILTEEQFSQIASEIESKDYISEMLPFIQNIVSNSNSIKHQVLGLYADSLAKLYIMMVKDINRKGFTICKSSNTLNKHILENFLTVSGRKYGRPPQYKDKIICHAIVLLLLINNFKISLDEVCEMFKLMPSTSALKVRVTGAIIVNTDSKKFVQLKLPLNNKGIYRRKSTHF